MFQSIPSAHYYKHIRFRFTEDEKKVVDECLNEYVKDLKIGSPEFKAIANYVITKGVHQISRFGCIPYSYKFMGNSPRIIPVMYGDTIHNTKRVVKDACYNILGAYVNKEIAHNMLNDELVVLGLDLLSYYISILIGLCSEHLQGLQRVIEGSGLCNYIG